MAKVCVCARCACGFLWCWMMCANMYVKFLHVNFRSVVFSLLLLAWSRWISKWSSMQFDSTFSACFCIDLRFPTLYHHIGCRNIWRAKMQKKIICACMFLRAWNGIFKSAHWIINSQSGMKINWKRKKRTRTHSRQREIGWSDNCQMQIQQFFFFFFGWRLS